MPATKKTTAPDLKDAPLAAPAHDDDSANNVWLAGLGAFARAQAEGSKVFDALVKEGVAMQRKTQALAEERLAEASQRMAEITARASGGAAKWDRLGGIFEDRVARALGQLGAPTAQKFEELVQRVQRLEEMLQTTARRDPPKARPKPSRQQAPGTKSK